MVRALFAASAIFISTAAPAGPFCAECQVKPIKAIAAPVARVVERVRGNKGPVRRAVRRGIERRQARRARRG